VADIMSKKLVVIGSGKIAISHIEAARANGFDLFSICGSNNSKTALDLAEKYDFTHYFPELETMLETTFDAAAIICSTINIPKVYEKLYEKNVPILAEKPYSFNSEDFIDKMLNNKKLLVGYNRRYYSSIRALKEKIESEFFYNAVVEISEISWDSNSSVIEREQSVLENSVHSLDLILYLFGDYDSIEINRSFIAGNLQSINARLLYSSGANVDLRISFGIPLNNSISVRFKDSIAYCKPMELFYLHSKMKMIPADSQVKFKRYQPIAVENWTLSEYDNSFKPGFYLQYKELSNLVDGTPIRIGATAADAYKVLKLSKKLIGRID
jgi:predicted dehydrogenase